MYDKTKTNQIKSTLSGKIGVMFSCWDLLHPGHILALKEAASLCDHLIVGLHVNPQLERPEKNEPIIDLAGRKIMLEGCKYINNYIEYETDLFEKFFEMTVARVLLIEPDPTQRRSLAHWLNQVAGYRCEAAVPTVADAVKLSRTTPFDFVLINRLMPEVPQEEGLARLQEAVATS